MAEDASSQNHAIILKSLDLMSVPRLNHHLMSQAVRENLRRLQTELVMEGRPMASSVEAVTERKVRSKKRTLTPDMAARLVKSFTKSADGQEVEIVLDCDASMLVTAQQKGAFVGKDNNVHFFTKAKVKKAEETLVKALSPYAPMFKDWQGFPIRLEITFCYPYTTGTPKRELVDYRYHIQRSDVDNLFKGVGDALTKAGFWLDDSVISDLHLVKYRMISEPYIKIKVKKLPFINSNAMLFEEYS